MMAKRKSFRKTDLSVPKVDHTRDLSGRVLIPVEAIPPPTTQVTFPRNPRGVRSFDFARWYGVGIDAITYACQRQIERYLAKQDADVEVSTVVSYCCEGLKTFLDFSVLRAAALCRPLTMADIDRDAVESYLGFLRSSGTKTTAPITRYRTTKPVLLALGRRGLISLVESGDKATFPRNPFPNGARKAKGEAALPRAQRQGFSQAVKTAVMPLLEENAEGTGELLAYALLIVALHTGRNTTPLLEMVPDCLRSHPREFTQFLVLYKRRGHSTSKVAVRAESAAKRAVESTPIVRPTVVRLIERTIALTAPLRADAPEDLKERLWLYRRTSGRGRGCVTALTDNTLAKAIKRLVTSHGLLDTNGHPLRINVSRLRKTFANRIFELTDGDLGTTAIALGNTPQVAGRNYLAPGKDAQKNWRFMGQCLVEEMQNGTLGATERTPMGRCTDGQYGQYAPKESGATCFSFLNCLRCRNYVVTGDDLYRLFSFYWRVLGERSRLSRGRWKREYSHIPRLIDRDVIAEGLDRKVFKQSAVDEARERARRDPHPFWKTDSIPSMEDFK